MDGPQNPDYEEPIKIAEDVYWVGFFDEQSGLHCNPYLIIDNEEAVVIDSGSRPDFPTVMMKILRTGIAPKQIRALIYQHYDPDLVGGISTFEAIIDSPDLQLISHRANHMFIRHYAVSSPLVDLESLDHRFRFSSGRELKFHETPYSHSGGSIITFDRTSGVLFTSDIFGSYGKQWELFVELAQDCATCSDYSHCPRGRLYCPLPDILSFHQYIMTSAKALRYALRQIAAVPRKILAPQHGSVITGQADIDLLIDKLMGLDRVGIDRVC